MTKDEKLTNKEPTHAIQERPRAFLFTVQLRETRVFWDTVAVEARDEDEARELARDYFQVDWSDSEEIDRQETILAVNGMVVETVDELPADADTEKEEECP